MPEVGAEQSVSRRKGSIVPISRRALAASVLFCVFGTVGAGPAPAAIVPEDVVLYHSFDGHSQADYALGSDQNAFPDKLAFVPGKLGTGIEVGEDAGHGGFATRLFRHVGNQCGAVSIWVNPAWFNKKSQWVCPVRVGRRGGSAMQLLLRPDGSNGQFMTNARIDGVWRWQYAETRKLPWKPDSFNHLVLTWGGGKKRLYLNGQLCLDRDALLNQPWGDVYLAIGQPGEVPTEMRALGTYDEMVLVKREITAEEVRDLMDGKLTSMLRGLRTRPAPPRHLRVGVVRYANPCCLVFDDEPLEAEVPITADLPQTAEISVSIALKDFDLATLHAFQQVLRVGGGATDHVRFPWRPTRRGIFKLSLTWKNEAEKVAETHDLLVFGVVSRKMYDSGRKPDSFFGNHFETADAEFAQRIGSKWVRLHDFGNWQTCWCRVEPESGRYRWFDDDIQRFADRQFCILGSLHRTAPWASTSGARQAVPRNWEEFENYVFQTVSRYKRWIRHWEVWNEPHHTGFWLGTPEEYAQLLGIAYRAAKRADPECVVLGMGGVSLYHHDWIRRVLAGGGLRSMDVFSIHGYVRDLKPLAADDFRPLLTSIRDTMAGGGRSLPIWNSEGGVAGEPFRFDIEAPSLPPLHTRDAVPNYRAGAASMVRVVVSQRASGVAKWMYYWCKRPPVDRALAHGSLMHPDGSPMPAALAYATCAYFLEDAAFLSAGVVGRDIRAALFRKAGGGTVGVLWSDSPGRLGISDRAGRFDVYDVMSNPKAHGPGALDVGPEPVFVVFPSEVDLGVFATLP